ncbi:MAG: CHAT domain-containing protein [Pyrinomonadaceae bacterium]
MKGAIPFESVPASESNNFPGKSIFAVSLLTTLLLISFSFLVNCANTLAEPRQSMVPVFCADQDTSESLTPGRTVEHVIKGGEVHVFSVSLAANQYVRIVIQRHGIDLFVNVTAPGGTATKYENPAGAQSPIFALVKAEIPGTYTVEIHPIKKWLAAGRYEIRFEEVASPNDSDEKSVAAQRKVAEGRSHQLRESADSSQAALTNYEEALNLWREAGDTFQEANTLHFIAQAYQALRDFDKAEEYYKRTLERRRDDREARAYTLLDLAEAYYSIKSPRDSLSHYQDALDAFTENKNRRGQALALTQLGLIHMRQYDWEGARKILQDALVIDRSGDDTYEKARVLNALGGVSDNQGQPEEAMKLYEQARAEFERLGDSARQGNLYINIGLHHDTWGEWREAFSSYNKALELLAAGETASEVDRSFVNSKRASVYYNIGSLYASLGDYTEGLSYLQRSLDLRPPRDQGATLMWFGYTHVLIGEPRKAVEYCDRAIKIQEANEDPRRAQSYTVMGMAQDALGNHEKAIEYFNKAFEIQQNEKTLDLKGQAITLDKRAGAFAAMGEVTKARQDLAAALGLWRTFEDRNGEALSLFRLARIERDTGNVNRGLTIAETAIKLVEPLRKNVVGQQLRASYFATKVDYYELYIDLIMLSRGNTNIAERTTAAFEASERERARGLLDTFSNAGLDSDTLKDPALSALTERRRLLQRSMLIKSTLRSQALLKDSNAKDIPAFDRDIAGIDLERDRLEMQIGALYPHYAALTSSEPLRATEIQQQLDDNTLLLEYALGDRRSYVWVVTSHSINGFELPARDQIEPVARRVTEALTARNRQEKNESFPERQLRLVKAEKEYSEASATLSKMVLDPVGSLLGQKRLVVVADGALQMVPFAALPAPTKFPAVSSDSNAIAIEKGKGAPNLSINDAVSISVPLIAEHEIITLPSASVLALQRRELANRKPARLALAVLADPVFDLQDVRVAKAMGNSNQRRKDLAKSGQGGVGLPKQESQSSPATSSSTNKQSPLASALRDVGLDPDGTMPRLALSREEAIAISRAAPANQSFSALDFKASRATAMSAELSKYRIIHFATHGVLDLDHPELSGIVLSMVDEKGQPQDGYLRLHDIYNLNLPAELVVLSACQTGIGKQIKGEGLIALTRGFMYAGAKSVVASLWKVDDAATSELMAEFYKQMFSNKLKPAAALREAQVNMSKKKRWQSPYYWAGFFLQGEWN